MPPSFQKSTKHTALREVEETPGGPLELCFGALPLALSFPVVFINGLAKGTDSMWIRFEEDGKLGGTANVLDEGVGTKQNSG